MRLNPVILVVFSTLMSGSVSAQTNRIDVVRHDAPELAEFGDYAVGVRTLEFVNPDQIDVLNSQPDNVVRYDRKLTVEIWYPAALTAAQRPGTEYLTDTRNLQIQATLRGRAVRDAAVATEQRDLPLVILSHGYPGNRYLMSHVGENLASKGYVVASIDHRESTYRDQSSIWSTLYHRPLDQLFIANKLIDLSKTSTFFLEGILDLDKIGIIGYSMGGYGLLVNLGAGYNQATAATAEGLPSVIAQRHSGQQMAGAPPADSRIKAGIAIAPCCMNRGMWDPESLARIQVPLLLMTGSADDTAGYENGVRAIFDATTGSQRYLLTYLNAGHNAIAPIPLPDEIHRSDNQAGAFHYTDAVWDSVRSSNVLFHFATAFFDYHLKGDRTRLAYLELTQSAADGVWAMADGAPTEDHTYWLGFPQYTARGLTLEHRPAGR